MLLRLHTETACRRGGADALRVADLDTRHALVRLTEKGGTLRWQRITPPLAEHLQEHAQARGAVLPADRLLRYRNGQPISSRRYDHLWKRIGDRLPWVAAPGISTHWLRHTTLTWVERHLGYCIGCAYAGHTERCGPATTTYIRADLYAVATALAAMTGQPHPLAVAQEMPWKSGPDGYRGCLRPPIGRRAPISVDRQRARVWCGSRLYRARIPTVPVTIEGARVLRQIPVTR